MYHCGGFPGYPRDYVVMMGECQFLPFLKDFLNYFLSTRKSSGFLKDAWTFGMPPGSPNTNLKQLESHGLPYDACSALFPGSFLRAVNLGTAPWLVNVILTYSYECHQEFLNIPYICAGWLFKYLLWWLKIVQKRNQPNPEKKKYIINFLIRKFCLGS